MKFVPLLFLTMSIMQIGRLSGVPKDIAKVDKHMAIKAINGKNVKWYNPAAAPFRIGGINGFEKHHTYRRLPVSDSIPAGVNSLADCTPSVTCSFRTNSKRVLIKVDFASPYAGMWHMSPVGRSGFDIYVGGPGNWESCGVSRFKKGITEIFKSSEVAMREFLINFPSYNGVKSIQIGLDNGAQVSSPTPYADNRRIVIYGGSTVQGGCASRPGRAFMNILGRKFNLEVINLGFSGSSRFEPVMAELTAAVERPALIIVEGDRNATYVRVRDLEPKFIQILRKSHPGVPIAVMQGNPWWKPDLNRPKIVAEQKKFMMGMKDDKDLYWWDCSKLIGTFDASECLIDGKHPTDLGFYRMSENLAELIEPLLQKYGVKYLPQAKK